jgi:serine/threonine protein kinase
VDDDCTAPALGHGLSRARPYLVTAYLPGYRCGSTLVGRPTPAGQVWTFGSALARVLAAVHARGVVHCDVKPSNLLIRGEDVRLIDFGIARHMGQRCGGDGTVECSRGWAAPEQLRTEPATPAMDVFAWGCLLAYLAGGVHPFASQDEQEWILRVQSAEPDLVGVPPGLAEVIRQSLARDPARRPSAADLATICRTGGAAPRRPAPPARPTGPAAAQRRRLPNRLATGLPGVLRALRRTLHRDRPRRVVADPPAPPRPGRGPQGQARPVRPAGPGRDRALTGTSQHPRTARRPVMAVRQDGLAVRRAVRPVRLLVDRLRPVGYFDGCGTLHLIFELTPAATWWHLPRRWRTGQR